MVLPEWVKEALLELVEIKDLRVLKEYSSTLSELYRQKGVEKKLQSGHHSAYLAARFPATYASAEFVFEKIRYALSPKTLLELGSGPGGASLAAFEAFPSLSKATLLEKDSAFLAMASRLFQKYSEVKFIQQDLFHCPSFTPHDLVLLSYAFGEIQEREFLLKAWQATKEVLVLIEPGTPKGFETILKARSLLLEAGGFLLAPCPHSQTCPMLAKEWCHFAARLPRTALHRLVKEGKKSFEDEKLSYVVFTKTLNNHPNARIVKTPLKRSGHVILTLCHEGKIEQTTLSRKEKERYKKASKAEWGEGWQVEERE